MITLENITVVQALSLLGVVRDGKFMSEARARKSLRDIGMKESEMNQPYPEEGMKELRHLLKHPGDLDGIVKEASEWMIQRN